MKRQKRDLRRRAVRRDYKRADIAWQRRMRERGANMADVSAAWDLQLTDILHAIIRRHGAFPW